MSDILAIIPAYCEEKNIGAVVLACRRQGLDVLVVDDHSRDATAKTALAAGATVVSHCFNVRYGCALQTGYQYAREHGYRAVVQLDGDGQHDPAWLPQLLAPILAGEADVVMGSRFLGDAGYHVPWARRVGQRLFGAIAGYLIGERVTDPTTGLQALSLPVVSLYCTSVFPDDYPDADMRIILHRMGFRVREIAVQMRASETGQSMHSGILRPLYYIYKMSLAMLIACYRKLPAKEMS